MLDVHPSSSGMKIATFNINNVNKRLANLLDWLREARPDVACLQELKATDFGISGSSDRKSRLRRGLARAKILERRRHPRARWRARRHAHRTARRRRRHAKPLYRGRRKRRADRHALCAERQPAAGSEVQIQAGMDGAPARARGRAVCARCAGRAGGRLQRRADRCGYLPYEIVREECAGAARAPRAVRATSRSGLDRRHPHAASG